MRNRQTKEPLVPLGATGEANGDGRIRQGMSRPRSRPARSEQSIHVARPLNVNDSDVASGLGILDEALAAADAFLA